MRLPAEWLAQAVWGGVHGVVSLHMLWDRWSLTDMQVETLLRGVEEVAVEAAFDPAAPTKVSPARTGAPPG